MQFAMEEQPGRSQSAGVPRSRCKWYTVMYLVLAWQCSPFPAELIADGATVG